MLNIAAVYLPRSDKKPMVDVIKKEYWFTIFSWHIWCLSWARTKYWLLFFRSSNRAINKCDRFYVFSVDLFIKIRSGSTYFREDSANMYWQFFLIKNRYAVSICAVFVVHLNDLSAKFGMRGDGKIFEIHCVPISSIMICRFLEHSLTFDFRKISNFMSRKTVFQNKFIPLFAMLFF